MKITLKKGQKLFFTSDSHYSHKNICRGETFWSTVRGQRDFANLTSMNDDIVKSINACVGKDDILFHLGDWAFGGKDQIHEFRQRIICDNVHLVVGNHDEYIIENGPIPQSPELKMRSLFSSINMGPLKLKISVIQPLIDKKQAKSKKHRFILLHFPIASWEGMKGGVIHLHGHVHANPENKFGPGKMMDVGYEGRSKPYELNEILGFMDKRPVKSLLHYDHHV